MAGLVVNTTQAMKQREPLPEGEYHAILTNSKVVTPADKSKYAYVQLEFTIAEDEGEEFAGRKAFRNISSSPDSLWAFVEASIALGADEEEVTQPEIDMADTFIELRGNECWLQTSIREWQRNEKSAVQRNTNVDKILAEAS